MLIWLMVLFWYVSLGQDLLGSPDTRLADIVDAQSFWLVNDPPEAADTVTIVAIDQQSRKHLGRKWPWERSLTARLITDIAALSPRAIGLDIVFSGTSEPTQDRALATALSAHPHVVLGYTGQDTSWNYPDNRFVEAAPAMGFVDKPLEAGRIRNIMTHYRNEPNNLHLSMEAQLVKAYWQLEDEDVSPTPGGLRLGNRAFIPSQKGRTPLNYLVYPSRFRIVPASHVLNGTATPVDFKDRIVLVGATDPLIHDEHPTVLGTLPGVTILGNAVIMVLSERFLHTVPTAGGLPIALVLGGLILIVNRMLGILRATLMSAALLILTYLSFVLLRGLDVRLPYFLILFAGVGAFLAYNGYRYISLLYVTNKIKNQAILDPLTGLYTSRYFMLQLNERWKRGRTVLLLGLRIENYQTLSIELGFDELKSTLSRIGNLLLQRVNRHFTETAVSRLYPDTFAASMASLPTNGVDDFWQDLLKGLDELAISSGNQPGITVRGCFIHKPRGHVAIHSDILAQMDLVLKAVEEGTCQVQTLTEGRSGREIQTPRMDMLEFLTFDWEERNRELEAHLREVIETNRALNRLNWGTLNALARAIDAKSPWTAGHSERVTRLARILGEAMNLDDETLEDLRRAALLHDIGKIAISRDILDKPGRLTDEEYKVICEHPERGARILEPIETYTRIIPIVKQHHEWFDGAGYPDGLAGRQITPGARILAVADVYDALISERPYRQGMPHDRAIAIIREGKGTQFDPAVVDRFLQLTDAQRNGVAEHPPCPLHPNPSDTSPQCPCTPGRLSDTATPCLR